MTIVAAVYKTVPKPSWFTTWEGTNIQIKKGGADLPEYRDGNQNIMLEDIITFEQNPYTQNATFVCRSGNRMGNLDKVRTVHIYQYTYIYIYFNYIFFKPSLTDIIHHPI